MAKRRKRKAKTTSFDSVRPNREGRVTRDQLEGDMPELSTRGGVEPTERAPDEYHDRTLDYEGDKG
ncbi:MAG: hypothetical protein ACT4O1_14070 [Gemmatimonadota bacterium]